VTRDQETDNVEAIKALLDEAADAHHVFERETLNGAYDEQWPAWYAAYVVEHGLGKVVGRGLTASDVGEKLNGAWDEYSGLDPKPTSSWSAWTARRIAADL
jgi:hypothetical protein